MNLATKSKISIIILLHLISKSISIPIYLSYVCSNTTEFAKNSKYHTNLNTLFRSLTSNATTNPTGFGITSVGTNTSDAVYGLFLCRGDLNTTVCSDCVKTATTIDLPKTCPNRKVAIIWYDECMLRYSDKSFIGVMDQSPSFIIINTQNMTGNQTSVSDTLGNIMNTLATQTAFSESLGKKYATTAVNLSSMTTMYTMEQCTPDLSSTDCYQCLVNAIGKLYVRMGARVLQPSCSVRYETYHFYYGATNSSLSPPSPSPSPGKANNITIMNNCAYTVWPTISTIGSSVNVPTGFPLVQGDSKIISIESNWLGRIWGRTRCSVDDHSGNFSCETGDCGTGKVECEDTSLPNPVTVADFRFGQNMYMYDISVKAGYNLPMMVAPEGAAGGDRCIATGCVFNLNDSVCPSSLTVLNTDKSTTIGCRNPCFGPGQCCQSSATSALCLSSDYLPSSDLFGKSCPRAINNPSDSSDTMFSCHSHKTSYKVTFCPSHNMTSMVSQPVQSPSSSPSISPFPSAPTPNSLPTINYPKKLGSKNDSKKLTTLLISLTISSALTVLLLYGVWSYIFRKKVIKSTTMTEVSEIKEAVLDSLQFDLNTIRIATNNFATSNKLGEGGFGEVYKGKLENGEEVAVKRLSKNSGQGVVEFKNEVVLVAKLRHKNLVKLLGYCVTLEEKILAYEFLPNSSLDRFLFDKTKKVSLDWQTRFKIIIGIAKGLLYLHEDSPLKIIHRDLKSSNILLDDYMNPKISDFGLAKLFGVDQTQGDTKRIVGTYGYMAPEYAITGHYSVKSDVFSFGVLVLEIVSGQRNKFFGRLQLEEALLHRAWRLWNEEKILDLVDTTLDNFPTDEVTKCIHIGLLCIQEDAVVRPKMTSIVAALNGQAISLPVPKPPHFFGTNNNVEDSEIQHNSHGVYTGTVSITDLYPRD